MPREIYHAISGISKSSRLVRITGTLRKELEHSRSLETWRNCLPWPHESHFIVKIFTDESSFVWGGVIQIPDKSPISVRDYWPDSTRHYPIVVLSLVLTLQVCYAECDKIAKWQFFMSRYIFLNQVFYIHGKFLYIHVKTIYSLSMRLASYQMSFFHVNLRAQFLYIKKDWRRARSFSKGRLWFFGEKPTWRVKGARTWRNS